MPVGKERVQLTPRGLRQLERREAAALLDRLELYCINARLDDVCCMVQRIKFLLNGGIR